LCGVDENGVKHKRKQKGKGSAVNIQVEMQNCCEKDIREVGNEEKKANKKSERDKLNSAKLI
jgi:hypothetical protein